VLGTANLLNAAKKSWTSGDHIFYHVSTDEVYGSLGAEGKFTETTPYDPRSPYSASKASSDHFVRAYGHTYGLPVVLSNCSNNYGPFQFPEKLIPLMINNIIRQKPLPVYGDGSNIRDWLWVGDHVKAIDLIFHRGKTGETYNIGGDNELTNLQLLHILCEKMDQKLGNAPGTAKKLISFIKDRPGHDKRYAIDAAKLKDELHWKPETNFESGIEQTIDWYLNNRAWLENIISGDYMHYYQQQYLT
jgi:dTDP-glucose 4,6-dehydratase